jgi:hypothetical protein
MQEHLFDKNNYIVRNSYAKRYSEIYYYNETIDLRPPFFESSKNNSSADFPKKTSNTDWQIRYDFIYFKNPLIILISTASTLRDKDHPSRTLLIWLNFTFYKHFIIFINCKYMYNRYIIQPYCVGKDKRSLAMVLPYEIVKSLKIDPLSTFLLLQVRGIDDLRLKIIREEDLEKKNNEGMIPVNKRFLGSSQQVSSPEVSSSAGFE